VGSDDEEEPVRKRRRAHSSTSRAGVGSNSDDYQTDAGDPIIEQPSDEESVSEGKEVEEIIGSDNDSGKVCYCSESCSAFSQSTLSYRMTTV
jgi:hypothetical protein